MDHLSLSRLRFTGLRVVGEYISRVRKAVQIVLGYGLSLADVILVVIYRYLNQNIMI